jgi:hypothetical protein
LSEFPERVYTQIEVEKAKELIRKGYKHRLAIRGSSMFRNKVREALELVKVAGYYDFLRTYIRRIEEIDGLTQLRQADAVIWANKYAVENSADAASFFVQKADSMKTYLGGELYYGGEAEKRSDQKRIEFLQVLRSRSKDKKVIEECDRLLEMWNDSSLVY